MLVVGIVVVVSFIRISSVRCCIDCFILIVSVIRVYVCIVVM